MTSNTPRRSRPVLRAALLLPLVACAASLINLNWANLDTAHAQQSALSSRAKNGTAANVNAERIRKADREAGNWMTHGRTYDEQRFSPLKQINAANVHQLGLAWSVDLQADFGLEATPLVIDGAMYVTTSWSRVHALDAATGRELWKYDPQVPRETLARACCGPVNRGVAAWEGRIFVGTLDGRLVALDAATGKPVWEVWTVEKDSVYTITGAPRVVKGKVVIGNGGAEFGVRGYVTAYDAATGQQAWRFYTVPGNPANPFESTAMKRAAQTWNGEWWKLGGGGTVWDSMAYDPELNLLYIGTGNGSPWNREARSPGGGDNLYLSSIVALNPDTGTYVWHYQTTPGDTWDYTATQHMILAELPLDGRKRKVIMQAPKNGFFYVLDRQTGEFISAAPFATTTWATHVNVHTGRPVETPNARYIKKPEVVLPGPDGAHNWQPMTYNPQTKLVYIPAAALPFAYGQEKDFKALPGQLNLALDPALFLTPEDPAELKKLAEMMRGSLLAWDPVKQRAAWQVQHPYVWNGGLLSTAGNLVFQGTAGREFIAYTADSGKRLWSFPTQTGVLAAPVTYTVNGEQYVSVLAGWTGALAMWMGASIAPPVESRAAQVFTFKLNGKESLPPPPAIKRDFPEPPPPTASAETVRRGNLLYHTYCARCHNGDVLDNGLAPDLRRVSAATHQAWEKIVLDGAYRKSGMPGFGQVLSKEDAAAIHAYVIKRANDDYRMMRQKN
jgi:quinohemoprotein ethanol dehydrogenase